MAFTKGFIAPTKGVSWNLWERYKSCWNTKEIEKVFNERIWVGLSWPKITIECTSHNSVMFDRG